MNVIIPIGGIGERFKKSNYTEPKPLVKLYGKEIITYLLECINYTLVKNIVIVYHHELLDWNFEEFIKNIVPINIIMKILDKDTKGCTETLFHALHLIPFEDRDLPVISLDCDSFYSCDILKMYHENFYGKNAVFYINDYDKDPIFSYIKLNENNNIIEIKEKIKISDNASTGCYCFSKTSLLYREIECLFSISDTKEDKDISINDILLSGELYVSKLINKMLGQKHEFYGINIDTKYYHCIGTPFQLFTYIKKYNRQLNLRVCFDLDNTLVIPSSIKGDYINVKPYQRNIELCQLMKNLGCTIIIYTARRMKTHKGNVGKVTAEISRITFDTLDKFNIPYDEVYFGKPYADLYIDDKGYNPYSENFLKSIGFISHLPISRDFHNISFNNNSVIKRGNDLEYQIKYLNNIPSDVSHLFIKMINYDNENYLWYETERIYGPTLSELYLNQVLDTESFKKVLENISEIHKITSENIDLTKIYIDKLDSRYSRELYNNYPCADKTYELIRGRLLEYLNKPKKITMIHGDPVFNNILFDQRNKVKLIDPRGTMGNSMTLYGDILYDYAKIYQSLIGYDEILYDKKVEYNYSKIMITTFFEFCTTQMNFNSEDIENIKLISASLLFTLIPLHNDINKNKKYYRLINKLIK